MTHILHAQAMFSSWLFRPRYIRRRQHSSVLIGKGASIHLYRTEEARTVCADCERVCRGSAQQKRGLYGLQFNDGNVDQLADRNQLPNNTLDKLTGWVQRGAEAMAHNNADIH